MQYDDEKLQREYMMSSHKGTTVVFSRIGWALSANTTCTGGS